jgi:hypothetical protein
MKEIFVFYCSMPRVKEITVFGNFVIVAKNKKTTVYKCKLCSKCLTTSSSTRLKQHLESCYVINEESSHEKRLKTDFEIIAVDDDLDNRNETNMSPQLVNLPNSSVSQGKMFTVFTIINGLQNNAITFSAHLLDPQQCGDKLNPAQIGALRLFIKEKVGDVFPLAWGQLLNYRAKSGVFGSIDVWEDSHLVDAITWWKIHGVETPQLQKLALSVLNIPTSSAASERCWSAMGNIHNTERNRLTDERIEKLTYIYFNERMLQDC